MSRRYPRYRSYFHGRQLHLDPVRKRLGGVCAGIAEYLDTEPLFIRICTLICLCLSPQITLIAYGIACCVLDEGSADLDS